MAPRPASITQPARSGRRDPHAACSLTGFLDLEHEVGHIRQMESLGEEPPPTKTIVRDASGAERVTDKSRYTAGELTTKMNAVAEYENRLQEFIRLVERDAPADILSEHLEGVRDWMG